MTWRGAVITAVNLPVLPGAEYEMVHLFFLSVLSFSLTFHAQMRVVPVPCWGQGSLASLRSICFGIVVIFAFDFKYYLPVFAFCEA